MYKLYKIYFSDNGRAKRAHVKKIIADNFENATIYNTIGLWRGKKENGLVIDIISDEKNMDYVIANVCDMIKNDTKQQAVVYTVQDVKFNVI